MSSFECLVMKINGNTPVLLILVVLPRLILDFFSELAELLMLLSSNCSDMLLIGNINIHVDNPDCSHTANFMDVLDCFNLIQHVYFPTHKSGHTLDLVCTKCFDIDQLRNDELYFSDHKLLTYEFSTSATLRSTKECVITYIKNIDSQLLYSLVALLPLTDSVDCYNSALSSILDIVAPLKE